MKHANLKRTTVLVLAAVIALGAVLRMYHLTSVSIWHDERVSILIANGLDHYASYDAVTAEEIRSQNDPSHVVSATIADNGNCVAYNLMLHFWLGSFGNSDSSARMLSVVFGILLIPLAFIFTRKLFDNEKLALIAAVIVAIHPLFIAYAHQARSYTAATFFTLWSTWFFLQIVRKEARFSQYILYALVSAFALLLHYLTAYVFIAHVIVFIYITRTRKQYINYLLSGSLVVLIFTFWMSHGGLEGLKVLDKQNARYAAQAANFKEGDTSFAMPANAKNIITGWVQVWLQVFGNQMQNYGLRIRQIGILVLIPLSALLWLILRNGKSRDQRNNLVFLLVLTFFQTAFATYLAIRAGHCISFQTLYASFVVPYACMLMAWVIHDLIYKEGKNLIGYGLAGFTVLMMGISWFTTYTNSNDIFPEQNGHLAKSELFEQEYQPGDTLTIKSSMDLQLISIYLSESANYILKVDTTVIDPTYTVERW